MALCVLQPHAALPQERPWSALDIRRLQIHSSRLVTSIFAGEFRSTFRGRGIEFETVREYQPGDDIRCIDWNVTARSGRPFVKQFVEEREMTVMLLLDRSASLECPSPRGPKSRIAAEICALLSFAAVRSNDRLGLITFTDEVEQYIPPAKGARHARRVIAAAVTGEPDRHATDLAGALGYLNRVCRRSATLFIVSDFNSPDFRIPLAAAARRHDVVAVNLSGTTDLQLAQVGLLDTVDAEDGSRRLIDTGNAAVRRAFRKQAAFRRAELLRTFNSAGVKCLDVASDAPPMHSLVRFFQAHQRQARH